ncbi:MAG: selenocysteine-specific translation elongation factor [Actinobacteria bacterium]|uniref:Selenocysteine-specific elongation factor n=1 Tax=freshwater metagenome TaxID=449393 RepID=A0A6J7M358_9ZZZZ|nr:selenocysteine-specific translation elongation factor [Actinomycetota bacterium]
MRIIATAGHVDHGKSTLIRTLTGINPDRWVEEQERGLTIDLGFAHLQLPNGQTVSFIDVPGHVRFISNMLAGVRGIHGCLLVVDAREGWKPQTEEHLRILHMVGVTQGLIALTKIDLCDSDDLELARLDIADHVSGTFLDNAPVIGISAPTGDGIPQLIHALEELAERCDESVDHGRPRLFIDRVFAAKGSGTVVTGTLTDGCLKVGDSILIAPLMLEARIRAIQTLGQAIDQAQPGHRVALNLAGVEHGQLARGDVVIQEGQWFCSPRVDASLSVLKSLKHVVSRRGAFTVHIGSDEIPARVRVLGPESIAPDEQGLIRIHLSRPIPLLPGDRYVLRESGRSETVGGGEILDINPKLPASRATPNRDIQRVINERGWVTSADLRLLTGVNIEPMFNNWVVSPQELDKTIAHIESVMATKDPNGVDLASFTEQHRAVISTLTTLSITDGRVRVAGVHDALLEHPIIERLAREACAPNPPTDISPPELRRLAKAGLLFEREGEWFHITALETAQQTARELLAVSAEGFTMSQFREALGVTRKHAVPLASELDARGMTRRRGDLRIAGPKL